jgi:dUTP pyrophosphatase
MEPLKVKKLDERAILPTRAHPNDAGIDLYCLEEVSIKPGHVAKIKTGIAVQIQKGYYGQLHGRSSISSLGIELVGGVIDEPYRGEIQVCLANINGTGDAIFHREAGSRIAQMILLPYGQCTIEEVTSLDQTKRGAMGFGSTGK